MCKNYYLHFTFLQTIYNNFSRLNDYCKQYGDFLQFGVFHKAGICIGDADILKELMENKNFDMRMVRLFIIEISTR